MLIVVFSRQKKPRGQTLTQGDWVKRYHRYLNFKALDITNRLL